jgi:hypothetical protein
MAAAVACCAALLCMGLLYTLFWAGRASSALPAPAGEAPAPAAAQAAPLGAVAPASEVKRLPERRR